MAELYNLLACHGPLARAKLVLVYCAFQMQADQLVGYLSGKGVGAMAYHAGHSVTHRQQVSTAMASRSIRVVACTVALSMGLDEAQIDGIVHFMLPASLEDYVQQVCVAFFLYYSNVYTHNV